MHYMFSQGVDQQVGSSDDFREYPSEEKGALKRKFSMGDEMEDKICDLYDLYVDVWIYGSTLLFKKVLLMMESTFCLYIFYGILWLQGLEDDAGPQIKRLYAEVPLYLVFSLSIAEVC